MASASPAKQRARELGSESDRVRAGDAEFNAVIWLSSFIAVAATVAATIGLFWPGPTGAATFTTIRGEEVELYGHGLYRYDTLFAGAGYRGYDSITLFLGVPLLIGAVAWFRSGSWRGRLFLSGVLSYMLYVYVSLALGAAFNGLFLVYVATLSASLFALGLTLRTIDVADLKDRLSNRAPRRATGIFLIVSGLVTAFVWLQPLLTNMLAGNPPKLLDSYTTSVTDALDLGIVTPLLFLSGFMILRRVALGYVIAFPLIGIIVILAPAIVAATISQISAGVEFSTGEIVGPIAGFTILGVFAIWLLIGLIRNVSESPRS